MSEEHEAMRQFADRITPPNWNVVLTPGDYKYVPRTLNIWLQVLEEREALEWFARESSFMGRVWGPMWFTCLSVLKIHIPEAARAYEEYGDACIGRVHIQLCPHMEDWQFILVHELAHVAATRCKAQKIRPFRGNNVFVILDREEDRQRGPLFQGAFFRMITRAERTYGRNDRTMRMWNSYHRYMEGG